MTYAELLLPASEQEKESISETKYKLAKYLPKKVGSDEIDYDLVVETLTGQLDSLADGKTELSDKSKVYLARVASDILGDRLASLTGDNPLVSAVLLSVMKSKVSDSLMNFFAGGTDGRRG